MFLTFTNLIDRLVCSLAVFSGLRRAELADLQTDDITKHHDKSVSVFVRNGKGSKQRSVVLPGKFGRELWAFSQAKGPQISLFEATPQTIANRWRAVCNAAGLWSCSTHWSRHAYTTLSLAGDKDGSRPSLIAVSRSLGHASVEQTGTYMHALEKRAPSAFISLDSDSEDDVGASSAPAAPLAAPVAASVVAAITAPKKKRKRVMTAAEKSARALAKLA